MASVTKVIKLSDNRKINPAPNTFLTPIGYKACTQNPYFKEGSAGWSLFNTDSYPNIFEFNGGSCRVRLPSEAGASFYTIYDALGPNGFSYNYGAIIDVELRPGQTLTTGGTQATRHFITESGRYVFYGVCTDSNIGVGLDQNSKGIDGYALLKELFFFNADFYQYTDFLEQPVDWLVSEFAQDINRVSMLQPRLGYATSVPTTGQWIVGDRVENLAWDGKFSTPIAWVCTASGSPGTWKDVDLFDAYNASKDPFFNSYIGGVWTANNTGDGASAIANNKLTLTGNTGQATVVQTAETAQKYEVSVIEGVLDSITGSPFSVRIGGDYALNVNTPGAFSGEFTPTTWVQGAPQVKLQALAGVTAVVSKALVRPKYPFLTKAPSSFSALPTILAMTSWSSGAMDTWYANHVSITYAAGVITMPANQGIWVRVPPLVIGKTYRVRVNTTAIGTGGLPVLRLYDAGLSIVGTCTLSSVLGIQEGTVVCNGSAVFARLDAGIDTIGINYVRLYAE